MVVVVAVEEWGGEIGGAEKVAGGVVIVVVWEKGVVVLRALLLWERWDYVVTTATARLMIMWSAFATSACSGHCFSGRGSGPFAPADSVGFVLGRPLASPCRSAGGTTRQT